MPTEEVLHGAQVDGRELVVLSEAEERARWIAQTDDFGQNNSVERGRATWLSQTPVYRSVVLVSPSIKAKVAQSCKEKQIGISGVTSHVQRKKATKPSMSHL